MVRSAISEPQYTARRTVATSSRHHCARRCNRRRNVGGSATTVTEVVSTPALAWISKSTYRVSAGFTGIERAISAQTPTKDSDLASQRPSIQSTNRSIVCRSTLAMLPTGIAAGETIEAPGAIGSHALGAAEQQAIRPVRDD